MEQPLFLKPIFKEMIWGGFRLHDEFGYTLPNKKIGEVWAISAHLHGANTIENGEFSGTKLNELWQQHPELFGHPSSKVFPLLTKILNAEDNLSVQVHPNDDYALIQEGELGKTECWYIVEAEPGAKIIYGHSAKTKKEFAQMIASNRWDELLKEISVKKGDFFYVPSGTIHAIEKGIIILETQQSSDTTYRLYDYDRKDKEGKKRQLHIAKSIEVATVPTVQPALTIRQVNQDQSSIITYLKTKFFTIYEWHVKGILKIKKQAPYTLATVVAGVGHLVIQEQLKTQATFYELEKGMSFILPDGLEKWQLEGQMTIIASEPGKEEFI